jgi:hypothetical protein
VCRTIFLISHLLLTRCHQTGMPHADDSQGWVPRENKDQDQGQETR